MTIAVLAVFFITHYVAMERGMQLDERLQIKRRQKNEIQSKRNY